MSNHNHLPLGALLVAVLSLLAADWATAQSWPQYATWLSGSSEPNQFGNYGTKGVPSPTNVPGARGGAVSWMDSCGTLWYFGGRGFGATSFGTLGDLWKWDGMYWTWVAGSNEVGSLPSYGTKGTPSPTNDPGARWRPVVWRKSNGEVWLFGGGDYWRPFRNDLWRWDGTDWTWMSGPKEPNGPSSYGVRGIPSSSNIPAAREWASSWIDASGNLLLFGGVGPDDSYANYLWKWDGTYWTWLGGMEEGRQGIYGTKGVAAEENTPGARLGSVAWSNTRGNGWLFGGYSAGTSENIAGYVNDLWKWDGASWTWVAGSSDVDDAGSFGVRGVSSPSNSPAARANPTAWTSPDGALYVFGGLGGTPPGGYPLNDLWRWDGVWTWVAGSPDPSPVSTFGNKGIASETTFPGGRHLAVGTADGLDRVWLFGGVIGPGVPPSVDAEPATNELWLLGSTALTGPTVLCGGQQRADYSIASVPGVTYAWSYSGTGATINGTGNSVAVDFSADATSGTLAVTTTNPCGTTMTYKLAIALEPALQPEFIVFKDAVHQGEQGVAYEVLTDAGASYAWTYSGTGATIRGSGSAVKLDFAGNATSGTLSVIASNSCGASTAGSVPVSVVAPPTVAISTDSTMICPCGALLTANPAGGTGSYPAYQWYQNGVAISGATLNTFTATDPGTYAVTVTDAYVGTSEPSAPIELWNKPTLLQPTHWWRAEGDATDSIGTAHGTLMNSVSFAPGKTGQAFRFGQFGDYADGYVSLGVSPLAGSGNEPFSVALWVYTDWESPNPAVVVAPLVRLVRDAGHPVAVVTLGETGASPALMFGAGDALQAYTDSSIYNRYRWTHIVMTYGGGDRSATDSYALFVDGDRRTEGWSFPWGGNGYGWSGTAFISENTFGGTSNVVQDYAEPYSFPGLIDEVQIYDYALGRSSRWVLGLNVEGL